MQTRDNLRKQFQELDNIENESAWPAAEDSLKEAFYKLEDKVKASDNSKAEKLLGWKPTQNIEDWIPKYKKQLGI